VYHQRQGHPILVAVSDPPSDPPSGPPNEPPPGPLSYPPIGPKPETPSSPLAPRPTISEDGLWWWDGQRWQPTDLQLRRSQGQPQQQVYGYPPPPVQVSQSSGAGNPFFSGLFGCFGVGAAVVILIVFAVVIMGVCTATALRSVPTPSP
jgi:hypothetical protein